MGVSGVAAPSGWKLVAALGTAQIASWGVLYYSFAVFLPAMQADLGLSIAELTGAFSLALGISAIAGLGVGRWLDRHSARPLMTGGSLLAVLLVWAWSRIDSLAELYLVFAGLGLAMAATLYEPAFIVITKRFRTRRREALTALTLIAALASLVFSPLSERLIAALGWREALIVLAALLATVALPLHAWFLRPLPDEHPAGEGVRRPSSVGRSQRRHLPGFASLTAAFVLVTLATSSIAVVLVSALMAQGHEPAFAALAAGLVGVAQIPGRVLFAIAGRWLGTGELASSAFALICGSLALLALGDARPLVVAFALVFGIGAGMTTLLRASLIGELYGSVWYGRNSSLMAAFVTAARALAPLLAGVASLGLGFTALLWILVVGSVLAGLAAQYGLRRAQQPKPRGPSGRPRTSAAPPRPPSRWT